VTGGGWGQDPFGGSPFGDQPMGGGPPSRAPSPMFTPPPVYTAPPPHRPQSRGANVLATLSVVFAFVFAPAGAVLGHLGLRQIARTGERGHTRAIIGIALSYTIIVISVVALVVWTATGTDSNQPGPGRTGAGSKLEGLLLSVEEVKAILNDGTNAVPVPNLTAQPSSAALTPSPGTQGSVDPADCAPVMIAASQDGYRDTGYRSVDSVTMSQPGPQGEQSVTQSVLEFPDSATAQRALSSILKTIQTCSEQQQPGQEGMSDDFHFTEPQGGKSEDWEIVHPDLENPGVSDGSTFDATSLRTVPGATGGAFYGVERSLGFKGNTVVDVSVRGLNIIFEGTDILTKIMGRMQ
jgi:hypothetical protein